MKEEDVQRQKEFLLNRALSYKRIFNSEEGANRDVRTVLLDLAKFCRAHESTFSPNTHVAARLDGRREVILRIFYHLQLTDGELWTLYSGLKQPTGA